MGAERLIGHMVHIHASSASPSLREYLALVTLYGQIYKSKRTQVHRGAQGGGGGLRARRRRGRDGGREGEGGSRGWRPAGA